jgi:hypothetical protein
MAPSGTGDCVQAARVADGLLMLAYWLRLMEVDGHLCGKIVGGLKSGLQRCGGLSTAARMRAGGAVVTVDLACSTLIDAAKWNHNGSIMDGECRAHNFDTEEYS